MSKIDPEIAAFRRHMADVSRDFPPFGTLPPETTRQLAARARATLPNLPTPGVNTNEGQIENVSPPMRYRIYRPAGEVTGVLFYLHGGGWTIFGVDTHDRLMRAYADQGSIIVIGFDYALAPEHVFPTALHQITASISTLVEDLSEEIGSLPVFLGGDSAGANLSLATALVLRDTYSVRLNGLMLSYGVYDSRCENASFNAYSSPEYMLTHDEMIFFWKRYIPEATSRTHPQAHLLAADVHALPPCFFTIAECDVLADESHAMAHKLQEQGNDATVRVYKGATHSFLEALDVAALARKAIADQLEWIASKS
ncbi:alpha/beta hydrolase [Gluconobacter wancherniae]|uniref:alpha/beta hydrolase n=1 Tax=Gluconobacter wancherniae TaxID=1307955 RepID=UPI001B8BA873|nr:alpha/beta hydrolase [Gluconobacter wancherniae]MBS1095967.1 alpha/beta hydrolase [Gluconobacter wancherniae]